MSQYEQLKLLYNQIINITVEEDKLFDNKAFQELDALLSHKNNLINQIVILVKNIKLSNAEQTEIQELECKYKENEERNIEKFSKVRDTLGLELKKTNKNLKLKNAYAKAIKSNQGSILDLSE